jgi:hypothetical protein
MSIVAVHGPYTFGSKAVASSGAVMGTVDPTNGLKWDFKLVAPTTRPDQDFSWAFPTDGTPTPQLLADPAQVTYATPGSKTVTLTVANTPRSVNNKALTSNVATLTTTATHGFKVGQSIVITGIDTIFNGTYTIKATPSGTTFTYDRVNVDVASGGTAGTATSDPAQVPAAGTYPITITAVSGAGGAGASLLSADLGGDTEGEVAPEAYDPSEHTVDEVKAYADELDDDGLIQELLDAETAGKNRTTLVAYLEALLPFDPGEYTIDGVLQFVSDNPTELDDVMAAEREGKNRSTLLSQLEGLRST